MSKPLALEYSKVKKWYSYQMFEPLKYCQSESKSSRKFNRSKQVRFEVSSLASEKNKKKENQNENTNSDLQVAIKINQILIIA